MDPWRESASTISESPLRLNNSKREARLGKRTLSSFALPSFDVGSSCSLNILNRAERLGISILVRKSSDAGSAEEKSIRGSGITCVSTFLFLLKVFVLDDRAGSGGTSDSTDGLLVELALSFCLFFDRKRFIVGQYETAIRFETTSYRHGPIRHTISPWANVA